MSSYSGSQQSRRPKIGRYLVGVIVIGFVLFKIVAGGVAISMDEQVVIEKGDTYHSLIQGLGRYDRTRVKQWLRKHSADLPGLKPGVVTFSGSYTPQEWVDHIEASTSKSQTIRLTLLEGWSSYDIDAKLVEFSLIDAGEFHKAITDSQMINEMSILYPWLSEQGSTLISLEGYLYPDTYFIDTAKPVIEQVIKVQLKAYQDKVWTPYMSQIKGFSQQLRGNGFDFDLSPYGIMRLASVIENEEKADSNKSIIAGIFLNRIQEGMRLDADVTLCYGKAVTYAECTPAFIVQHLYDKSNPYNTRQVTGMPPTPISNPAVVTIKALLEYTKSNNFYYLHDSKGKIYPAATLDEHASNKARYLN